METFGRYRLVRHLATGGMADVWLCQSAGIDGFEKSLVLKRLRADRVDDERLYSLFIEEARLSINFTHPNIVQVFDFGKIDNQYYLAMEYVRGCDAATLRRLPGVIDQGVALGIALYIMEEVCKGLDYAHNHVDAQGRPLRVVHRDISPSNVLLGRHGGVKIADFGIATVAGRTSNVSAGHVMGKLYYMSPEHLSGQPVDQRSDLFSAGLVLWGLLCGRRAYDLAEGPELVQRVRDARIDPPSTFAPGIPPDVDELVMRALKRDPNERWPNARELGRAIHAARVRHAPEVSDFDLQALLEKHDTELASLQLSAADSTRGDISERLAAMDANSTAEVEPSAFVPPPKTGLDPFFDKPELVERLDGFRKHPSLWRLVEMAELCARGGHAEAAQVLFRACAVKFAQEGLLAQALRCAKGQLEQQPFTQLEDAIAELTEFVGLDNAAAAPRLFRGNGPLETFIRQLLVETPAVAGSRSTATPLLSYLTGAQLARLCREAPLRRFDDSASIVAQGDQGRTMYLIGAGRVVVHALGADGKRKYLSSLMAGDFFGENSFFTGAPRIATVESQGVSHVFEIDQRTYDGVMGKVPEAAEVLLRFYKERVVDTVLAKSKIFGLLPAHERRSLVRDFRLRAFEAGELVLREGDTSDQIYLIKDGSAEVFTEAGGARQKLAEIGPLTLFGEIAALRRVPRTASVVATTRLEALEASAESFRSMLDARQDVAAQIWDYVEERLKAREDRSAGMQKLDLDA